jgi:membrane-bound lytic murein transglycosylase MltF
MKIIIVLALLLALLLLPLRWSFAEAPINPSKPDIKTYSIQKVLEEFGGGQWTYFNDLIYRESKWDSKAQNRYSTAFGLGQFLNSTWKTVGCTKTLDPYIQVDCTIKYVKQNYGNPHKAIRFHNARGWY